MGDTLSSEEIRKMVNNTADLQQKAAEALSSIANRQMKVFDPRNEADITSEDGAIVWSSKSIELAYDALKKGFGLRKSPFYRGNVDLRKANLTFQYTEEEIAEIIRCKKDIVYFANTYIYLKTPEDIRVLMTVLNRLVDKGNTVIVIEHNLDVIKLADYIIDMGPEGGRGGGQLLSTGTPEEVAKSSKGYTPRFIKEELKN